MRILYVGPLWSGSTCLQRMQAMQDLGHEIVPVDTEPDKVQNKQKQLFYRIWRKIFGPADLAKANHKILSACQQNELDVVWIDKGVTIKQKTLVKIKEISSKTILVHYNPDDPFGAIRSGWKTFLRSAPFYDVNFVSREENLGEYKSLGCKNVYRFYRGYYPKLHWPITLSEMERKKYSSDVCFIGTWETERENYLVHLVKNGIPVNIWGRYWNRGKHWNLLKSSIKGIALWGEEYVKGLCYSKICLCFLRKQNRDQQNSRTFEIPACGGFMLAERTNEHLELFEEGKEAEFFENENELLDKINYYLSHPEERKKIAAAGRKRCLASGYSCQDRVREMFARISGRFGIR